MPDFLILLAGLKSDTPLMNLIRIRSEKDMDKIQKMTPEERKIRREWQQFLYERETNTKGEEMTKEERQKMIEQNEQMIKASLLSYAIIKRKETE